MQQQDPLNPRISPRTAVTPRWLLAGTLLAAGALSGGACDKSDSLDGAAAPRSAVPASAEAAPAEGANLEASAEENPQENPQELDLATVQPQPNRAGILSFRQIPGVIAEEHTEALAARLRRGGESPAVRAALGEAVARSSAAAGPLIAELFAEEADPKVRVALTAQTWTLHDDAAYAAIVAGGLADPDPEVRQAAAIVAARSPRGQAFAATLAAALDDPELLVRVEAARALRIHPTPAAQEALERALGDDNAELRLQALRALDAVDPAAARVAAGRLTRDPDPRVATAATRLTGV